VGGVIAEDLESRNGTWINGKRVNERVVLAVGDLIRLGATAAFKVCHYDPTEQELLRRQRMNLVGELSLGLAHDFNNMLAVVSTSLDFLRALPAAERGSSEADACIADALGAVERAAELSYRILSSARTSSGEQKVIDLSRLFRGLVKLIVRTIPRGIHVESDIDERIHVRGDAVALQQALMNLCVNARDAMPDGGTLSISLGRSSAVQSESSPDGSSIVFSVTDTGCGMDAGTRRRLFEPFFTTKGAGVGFGLGLSTVAEVISQHGGRIGVESELGAGTTFTVHLPRAVDRAVSTSDTARAGPPSRQQFVGARVLLVDDEQVVRRSLRRVLKRARFRVSEAADGVEALEACRVSATKPDIVVLDLDMPRMDGVKTSRALCALGSRLRIVVVTGAVDAETERELLKRGVSAVLRKPVSVNVLVAAITEALSS